MIGVALNVLPTRTDQLSFAALLLRRGYSQMPPNRIGSGWLSFLETRSPRCKAWAYFFRSIGAFG